MYPLLFPLCLRRPWYLGPSSFQVARIQRLASARLVKIFSRRNHFGNLHIMVIANNLVVRSHEVKDEGYEIEHDVKLMTVFSAPNYCDQERREKSHQCDLLETLLEFVEVVYLS
ncbi:putative protein-serine/threonine phosphatase [Helianthus anomalus]